MELKRFFEDDKGDLKIIQPPNLLLGSWLLLQALNIIVFHAEQPVVVSLARLVLFAWAYVELRQGESPFRKMLGGIILLAIIISELMRWQ